MQRKGYLALLIFYFTVLLIVPSIHAQGYFSQGSNWDTSCDGAECESNLYSYEKYWHNQTGWEEIDENLYACPVEGATRYCSRDYYYQMRVDDRGNISASIRDAHFIMRPSNLLGTTFSFEPIIMGSTVTYENIVPGVDLKYQFLPKKLKEEIVINQRPSNLPYREVNFTFSKFGTIDVFLSPSFACDSNISCIPVRTIIEEDKITLQIPRSFLNQETLVYPVIIDPTIQLNNSDILWNGFIQSVNDLAQDPPLITYNRYNNPSDLLIFNETNSDGDGITDYRANIDWNLSAIPDNSAIRNVTLFLHTIFVTPSGSSFNLSIRHMSGSNISYPDQTGNCPQGNCQFYTDMGNGTEYNRSSLTSTPTPRNYTLSSSAILDVQNSLTTNVFSTGLSTDYHGGIYIGARDNINVSRRPLLIIRYGVNNTSGNEAIIKGINNSIQNNVITSSQLVYLVNEQGQQSLGTFDKATILNNQTWAFNYLGYGELPTYMYSLFRVLNIWENESLTFDEVVNQVGSFINVTKY